MKIPSRIGSLPLLKRISQNLLHIIIMLYNPYDYPDNWRSKTRIVMYITIGRGIVFIYQTKNLYGT